MVIRAVGTITIVALALLSSACEASGQTFEGKIIYQNVYKSKLPGVTDDQLAAAMGSKQDYFIKDGNYKSISNGPSWSWQIYIGRENRLYNKMENSEAILWIDGAKKIRPNRRNGDQSRSDRSSRVQMR